MTPERKGTRGLAAIGAALALFLLTAVLGPSAFVPALPGAAGAPPFSLNARPPGTLLVVLVVLGVAAGAAGLALCLAALRRGWRVPASRLVGAGLLVAAAFAFLPPVGSTDHLNYAAYGRMAATGHDPYATRASDLPHDPVINAVQEWQDTPSVYGPVATAGQALASWVGGDSVKTTVFVLSLLNLAAFAVAALVLHRTARDDTARLRAALLWTCNPLMLFHLMAGAHNDVQAVAPMVAALAAFRAGPGWALLTGALVGTGTAIKLPAALVGGGPAWCLLRARRWPSLAALFAAAGAVAAAAFPPAGPHVFDQLRAASNMVSLATPWHLLDSLIHNRAVIKVGWVALMLALAWLLYHALPRDPLGDAAGRERREGRRVAAALVLAWLFAAPYELPWYDGFGWAVLALLPASRMDQIMLVRTAVFSLAYLPARDPELVGLPEALRWFLPSVVRSVIVPVLLTGVLVYLVRWCLAERRRAAPPASAAAPRG
ncbi:polyprenol phosphomannose-dependent alpha 1,6 mannosyltransferase MptB [Actinomadura kijaniata]|uniref:polyprenol phosphomannose-dependent alpha 1,6 mannosyltransferase MptB n=1 Tax=Actinomadura kijaniata TaxID=46161 RepID=UPI003F1E3A92